MCMASKPRTVRIYRECTRPYSFLHCAWIDQYSPPGAALCRPSTASSACGREAK